MFIHHKTVDSPARKNIVQAFWQVNRNHQDRQYETIIPKGVIEIIFNLSPSDIHVICDGKKSKIPRCFINGLHTSPIFQIFTGH